MNDTMATDAILRDVVHNDSHQVPEQLPGTLCPCTFNR